jgi:putative restriction endonuclease
MPTSRGWTRQQLLVAFGLYCQIPFGKMHSRNPEIVKYSELIDRTPSALAMKLTNIASLDPAITNTGRKGLKGASSADRSMWDEMTNDWEYFATESGQAIDNLSESEANETNSEYGKIFAEVSYVGGNKIVKTTARVGQNFFRNSVLSAYNNQCCITGLTEPRLLVASHIIPWSQNIDNRLNPKNGLALSMLHDKAFDIGLITIEDDLTVNVSKNIDACDDYYDLSIKAYDGKKIFLPEKFQPEESFLEYHRKNIFERWLKI